MTMNGTTPSSTLAPSVVQNTANGVNGVVAQPVVAPDVSAPPRALSLPSPTIIIAILGAAVTYLYGAGLLILAQQLRYIYRFDFAVALNAALQVPKQTIVIEGLKIFLSQSTLLLFSSISSAISPFVVWAVVGVGLSGMGLIATMFRGMFSLIIALFIAYVLRVVESPTWIVFVASLLVTTGASLIMEGLSEAISTSEWIAKVRLWWAVVDRWSTHFFAAILTWARISRSLKRFIATSFATRTKRQATRFYGWPLQGRRRWIVTFVAFDALFILSWLSLIPPVKLLTSRGWGTIGIGLIVGTLGIAVAKSKMLTGLRGAAMGLVLVYLSAPFPIYYMNPCGLLPGDILRDSILPSVTLRDKGAGLVSGTLLSYADGHWNVIVKGQRGYSVFRDAEMPMSRLLRPTLRRSRRYLRNAQDR